MVRTGTPLRVLAFVLAPTFGCGALIGADWNATLGQPDGGATANVDAAAPGEDSSRADATVSVMDANGTDASVEDAPTATDAADELSPIYCESGDASCFCGNIGSVPNGTAATPCSRTSTSPDAWCCASDGWPARGSCSCLARPSCYKSADGETCQCGLGEPAPGDTVVPSCSGALCCNGASNIAPTCVCWNVGTQCVASGDVRVDSCSVASLACEGHPVTDCR